MSTLDLINKKIIQFCNKYSNDFNNFRIPLQYEGLKKRSLLFVGINPSFRNDAIEIGSKGTPKQDFSQRDYFELCKDPFFGEFCKISDMVSVPWEHVDLLPFPETNQALIKESFYKVLNCEQNTESKPELLIEIFDIFYDIVKYIDPVLIIICNAFASDIFTQYMSKGLLKCEYELELNDKKYIILLSGMLSGQRAMDKYSKKRLIRDIETLLKTQK